MFKKYRILKWASIFIVSLIVIIVSFGFWFKSLIPSRDAKIELSQVEDLSYLSENIIPVRGKILAVVTSAGTMGNSGKTTGYELTELARAYYIFKANGFEVDIASPEGGEPPVVIDDEDMGAFDYAFLNDSIAQYKTRHTIKMEDVVPEDYQAVFFAGGKGAMFDFPDNKSIQSLLKNYYQSNKVIGAVCHGPSALVNVTLDNGRPLLENKNVSGFTNKEELLLISDAESIFPFLLQDKLTERGANFDEGAMYLEKISHDKNLITGQNPWSTWSLAESMIKQMGYTPKPRAKTDEENAVKVLSVYKTEGKQKARELLEAIMVEEKKPLNRVLIAKHSIISAMKGEVGQFFNMIGLVSYAKKCESRRNEI
ncbi:type 1 glutamine amidotransferase domain-containing protein [Flagellimonas nanhaiensis]|uniref:Type 1 glutamine amidotransferase domain-containing protein n=1 Tax=Flagellimonas nanhaiensis TaxID=2292706 RepID=A0A371JUT8_9FLAO|nr:type 1 glutamine amidotransferase domain-containing protein [Allomuricauda nanhaiensis]RDY61537.1 type 1 glutamine amidotransferase domain-containing protein [Allomuricauda nanhaiensis]